MQASVYNMAGELVDTVELSDEVFGTDVNEGLLHQAVLRQLANRRQGTADTKTRGRVSGGGRKPYKQKGTGRARQGTIRAPHWRGGGVVFGPHPRDYHQAMPKKMRRAALRSALSAAFAADKLRLLDQVSFEAPKTREAAALLDRHGLGSSTLVVTRAPEQNVVLSVRNIPGAATTTSTLLNVVDVMKHEHLVMTLAAARQIEENLGSDQGVDVSGQQEQVSE